MAPASLRRACPLLGTYVDISAAGSDHRDLVAAVDAALAVVEKIHRLMSFHDPASDVSRLHREAALGPVAVDPWAWPVLDAAIDLNRRSHAAFDITVAPMLQDLGLLPSGADRAGSACAPAPSDTIELMSDRRVHFRHAARIDLGGVAKGFAVDRAVAMLRMRNVTSGLVNAGGDLAAFGPHPQTIHLRDPRDPTRSIGAIDIRAEAVASTGGRFDPFTSAAIAPPAVIDPQARAPARTICGVTVRAPTCLLADALTKVVMIEGEAAAPLLDQFAAAALMVRADGEIVVTPSWQAARAA